MTNYTVLLHFDSNTTPTASSIYSKALSTGNDVRVVYNGVEIDRHIQRFTNTNIDIWFKVQAAITDLDSASYVLYYGYSGAGSPPASTTNVYGSGHKLIAHFDNSTVTGVDGETGTATNTTFTSTLGSARIYSAIGVTASNANLTYTSTNMFNSTSPDYGTIEFWFKPNGWNWSTDTSTHYLFSASNSSRRFTIYRTSASSGEIRAILSDSAGTNYICTSTSLWNDTNAHHIAFSWSFGDLLHTHTVQLFLDGASKKARPIMPLSGMMTIASSPRIGTYAGTAGTNRADGYFDELRCWTVYRTDNTNISYVNPEPVLNADEEESR